MILYERIRKSFGEEVVLQGVDLEIPKGETLAILGRSGSGKSVLVSMLVGLVAPDEGRIWIDDIEVTRFRKEEEWDRLRLRIGFLFQGSALYDSMTVAENVAFPLIHRKDITPFQARGLVRERLRQVDLDPKIEVKYPSELSGGMQRRVALARTLILEPDILVYDEPTTGLDPITSDGIGDLIRQIRTDMEATSIVVTHDVRFAYTVSDQLAVLYEGRIVHEGPLEEMSRSAHPEVRAFLTAPGRRQEAR
jgi:phospholipid/cholesterol/gamma-HCH transport system ATP-binding protein